MAPFLSSAWVDALDAAARSSASLAACAQEGDPLVLEQRVALDGGAEAVHHFVVGPDIVSVAQGRADTPDVVFAVDLENARDLARGTLNAQEALARGHLRLSGDIEALARRADTLLALDDVFAAVRADTTF